MEILSPASNVEHIRVAIDEKANAVYGGLKKWNARNKAINFTADEYNRIIEELHKNGIKFYLTLNILMLDEELYEVVDFLNANTLPDAFIATDIGLIRILQNKFPQVPIHFSTQFGCHNIDDVNYIKSLGGERAILARELTLNELQEIRKNTDAELECFVWGSQCLSFSGLCFFGTLINGGGGNRGKCIITCRDIYEVNNIKGHYLYVPDMDCTNLISKLSNIDCLKIEGRRRNPIEIKKILRDIYKNNLSTDQKGYLYGTNIQENNLFEQINTRVKPTCKSTELQNVDNNDVLVEFSNNHPIKFVNEPGNNIYYLYTEIKKPYLVNKKNIFLEISTKDNLITSVLYLNHKGEGKTFFSDNNELIEIDFDQLVNEIELNNQEINVYKIKYIKTDKKIFMNKNIYKDLLDYINNDCKKINYNVIHNNNFKLKKIYLETKELDVIEKFCNDPFIKVIYDIETHKKLSNISDVVKKYGNKIIYKLPLFNWKSQDVLSYYKELRNQEVMFTRLTQINLCKNIKFKKKYVDYTIYIWNNETLKYLIENGVTEFTGSPELSYERNKKIFSKNNFQMIIGGKLPLVYSRSCFSHIFKCTNCNICKNKKKDIFNVDKTLDFEIYCNDDYRYILNSQPILNDYRKVNVSDNTSFRYIATTQSIENIEKTISSFKNSNYYNLLLKDDYWNHSYECNLLEGKE